MARWLSRLLRDNRGATVIEYGLIIAMIVLAMMAALGSVAGSAIEKWNYIADRVTTA